MKNKFFYLGASLAVATAFTACSNDELIQDMPVNQKSFNDGRIAFVQQTKNLTRGVSKAETKNHYEFGVFTFLDAVGTASNSTGANPASSITMPNFLVGYASETTNMAWYKDRISTQTWGNAASGDLTDAANNVSSWVYEQMGNTELTKTNSTMEIQSLKYWNDAAASHIFVAYTPYLGNANNDKPMSSFDIAANSVNTKADVTFTGLSSFYTSPAVQTAGARVKGLKANTGDANYDDNADIATETELLNANEALYAYNKIDRANYGNDVPLTFQHVNAKINLKFYHTIKGYDVQLIDMVPADVATKLAVGKTLTSGLNVATGKATTTTKGVQLTPAIAEYVTTTPQKLKTDNYAGTRYEAANVTINGLDANGAVGTIPALGISGTETTANLQFAITAEHDLTGTHAAAVADNEAVTSTLYALPVYQGGAIKTAMSTVTGNTANEVAKNTGYTLHVSYELIPTDGTTKITVYDARVFIAPEFCKWEAGKAYTYVFKITDQSNGTTDPTKADPEATDEPYVDPDDPRVPEDPALKPIVFDGVVVCDYDEVPTGKDNYTDEWVITDPASWKSKTVNTETVKVAPALLSTAQYKEALGLAWTTAYTAETSLSATYDKATSKFTVSYSTTELATWPAAVQEKMDDLTDVTFQYNSGAITPALSEVELYSYSAWLWANDAATQAMKINVKPSTVDYAHKDVVQKYHNDVDEAKIVYVKTTDGGAATYYDDKDLTVASATDNVSSGWTLDETTTKYYGATITYATPTVAVPAAHAGNAYAIVKTK